jgi:hypothetical protein
VSTDVLGDIEWWLAPLDVSSLPPFFFASYKGSKDADGSDGCTGDKGGLESRIGSISSTRASTLS